MPNLNSRIANTFWFGTVLAVEAPEFTVLARFVNGVNAVVNGVQFASIGPQGRGTAYPKVGDEVICLSPGGLPDSESYIMSALRRDKEEERVTISAVHYPAIVEHPFEAIDLLSPIATAADRARILAIPQLPLDERKYDITINRNAPSIQEQGPINLLVGDLQGQSLRVEFANGRMNLIRTLPGDLDKAIGWRWYDPPMLSPQEFTDGQYHTLNESSLRTVLGALLNIDSAEWLLSVPARIINEFLVNRLPHPTGALAPVSVVVDVGYLHNHVIPVIDGFTPFRLIWRQDD